MFTTEAATGGDLPKKMFLKISQNSQENTYVSLFLNRVAGQRLWHRYFPVNFAKFLRTPFLQNTSGRLLLTLKGHVYIKNMHDLFLDARLFKVETFR